MSPPGHKERMTEKIRMIKAMTRLVVLAVFSGLTACGGEVLLDEPQPVECVIPIVFDNGFVDHTVGTRAATSPLSHHTTTMGVWGWQTLEGVSHTLLFSNHPIYYKEGAWTYSPLRYWDSGSIYSFFAYAPHHTEQKGGNAQVRINVVNDCLSIDDVQLQGDNLQTVPSLQQKNVFSTPLAPHDVDWMVARTGQQTQGSLRPLVAFTLQHILAKLNVRLRISEALAADPGLTKLTIDTLRIGTLAAKGHFEQLYDATPSADGPEEEWTVPASSPRIAYLRKEPFEAVSSWHYIMESLLIPQALPYEAEVRLVYTATFSDARTEQTTYRMPLREVFSTITHFVSGNNYTISFQIAPDAILFDASTDTWTERNEKSLKSLGSLRVLGALGSLEKTNNLKDNTQ